LENIEVAPPGPGEVRIQVKALGLNRAESMYRLGRYVEDPAFPSGLGYEAAGTVERVGPGVTGFARGEPVSVVPLPGMGRRHVYAELVNYPAHGVVKHPRALSFEQAAAVWMQYVTAYGALVEVANIQRGDFVAITAASSSVGLAAIQVARQVGAKPIAVTRTRAKAKALLDLGAADVIVTSEEDLAARLKDATDGAGCRAILDAVAGPQIEKLAEGLAQRGTLIEYGVLSGESTPIPLFPLMLKGLMIRGFTYAETVLDPNSLERAKRFILEGLESGRLLPLIARTFELDQIVEAHRFLESNEQIGKIVVKV
jgi:NADPH:quinone reductase-like Zn-dependent oxidoreductase